MEIQGDSFIQKINRIKRGVVEGKCGITSQAADAILRRHLIFFSSRATKALAAFALVSALMILGGYLAMPSSRDQSNFNFRDYNRKTVEGTNTRVDDLQFDAASNRLHADMNEKRGPEMAVMIGFCLLLSTTVLGLGVKRQKKMVLRDREQVEALFNQLETSESGKAS